VRDFDGRDAELASVERGEILDLALELVALLGELGNGGLGLGLVSGQRGNDGVTLSERGLVGLAQLGKLGNLLLGFSLEGGDFGILGGESGGINSRGDLGLDFGSGHGFRNRHLQG